MHAPRVLVLATLSVLGAACASFGSDPEAPPAGGVQGSPEPAPAADPKKNAPPPPQATPPPSEVTEKFGYFVTEKGDDEGDGSRTKPFATIGKALSKAKVDGKRVYVCAGSYAEAIVLEDGVSMIGGYDCSTAMWANGTKKSRIESRTSPAMRAKDITTKTRFEGFDVSAPGATEPSGSSIGFIAENVKDLTIVDVRITSGAGAPGRVGVEGLQLRETNANGGKGEQGSYETASAVPWFAALGGTSTCEGAPNHNGGAGGLGGRPGHYLAKQNAITSFWDTLVVHGAGEVKTNAEGKRGAPGASATQMGKLQVDGYVAADGEQGGDGQPGAGGSGGDAIGPPYTAAGDFVGQKWISRGGGGGGAGGCPGLAGTPGKGGGASIAVVLFASPITFEKSSMESGNGGAGGRGTFGSNALPGGAGGLGLHQSGRDGGAGGASGVSGSGAGGPSWAIAHHDGAPKLVGTTLRFGAGGAGALEETSATGKVLAASTAGTTEAQHVF